MNRLYKKDYLSVIVILCMAAAIVCLISRYVRYEACFSGTQKVNLPIIMYHNISEKSNMLSRYCISVKQFENDLIYIKENGYTTINMTELIEHVYNGTELPEKPIIITFDDGYESFYKYAYPLLQKYDMKAVMSIVGTYTDLFTETEDHNVDYSHLNWNQVHELNNGKYAEIQNHTYNLHEITSKRRGCGIAKGESFENYKRLLNEDIGRLQKLILEYTGKEANTFTYPYGHISEGSVDIIKDMGFKAAFTCTEKVNVIEENRDFLYDLGRFNRENGKNSADFFAKVFKEAPHN